MQTKCKEQQQQQLQQQPHLNNHFSHNLATTKPTKTISSDNNGGLIKDFSNQQLQQPFYSNKTNKLKRLSVLSSTTMPIQQQQQQLYQQPIKQNFMTQQQCQQSAILRKSPKPHYSFTLNNKYAFATTTATAKTSTAPNPPPTAHTPTATRNSLSSKDLKSYEFTHLKECNPDYYLPSSVEILGIQKSLQPNNDDDDDDVEDGDKDVANLDVKKYDKDNIANEYFVNKVSSDDDNNLQKKQENNKNELVIELDNKSVKRLSANLNDLEITKNATNNLLKQEQQTNRLWYH